VTFNPTTFLPPVLAVGQGDSSNGRQQLGSGLVTHRGIIDSNSFRAQGNLYPQSGRGLELLYDQTAKQALIYSYDRDAQVWTDLNLTGKNVMLNAPGGKVTLPAGTAQALIGSYRATSGWAVPAASGWYESAAQVNVTCLAGSVIRLEACGTATMNTLQALFYVGIMRDGALYIDTQQCVQAAVAGGLNGWSIIAYDQNPLAGVHRYAVSCYLNAGAGGFWSGSYTSFYITEQRA
jgi:hypothetical protein